MAACKTERVNACNCKMVAVKVTPLNDFPLGLIRSHVVVNHLLIMLCVLQRVVMDLCTTLYIGLLVQGTVTNSSLSVGLIPVPPQN
jgi:hypothetical protein